MRFLAPNGLWLLVLALPIVALYVLRLHRREERVPSLRLWQAAAEDRRANRPWQKLRRRWLMLLQLLILLLLAFAAARPAVPAPRAPQGQSLVLLDVSASMQAWQADGRSRFEAALAALRELAAALEAAGQGGSRVTVIAVGPEPMLLLRDGDAGALRRALPLFAPTDGVADWDAAAALAVGLATESEVATLVITDGAISGPLPALPGNVEWLIIGDAASNVGLTALSLRRSAETYTAFVRVRNAGPARQVTLLLLAESEVVGRRVLDLPEDGEAALSFPDLPIRRWFEARLEGAADAFSLDDRAWIAAPVAGSGKVLLATPGNRFLDLALRSLPGIVVEQSAALPQDTAGYGVAVVDGATFSPLPEGHVWALVPGLETPCGEPTGVFTPTGLLRAAAHPLMQYVTWEDVHIARATRYTLPADALVLLDAPQGPLLWLLERPGQRLICQAFALQDSDLPLRVAFPILTTNLLSWLLPQTSPEPIFPLPAGRAWEPPVSLDVSAARLIGPDVAQVALLGPERAVLPHRAGLYRLEIETPQGPATHYAALALLDAEESDLRPRLEGGAVQLSSSHVGAATGWRDLSRWVAAAALVLLIAEGAAWWGRGAGLRGELLPVFLRLALLIGLALALANVRLAQTTRDLVTVFVVDRSASVEAASGESAALLEAAWRTKSPRDRGAVVVFGAEARVAQPPGEGALSPEASLPRRDATDIEAAVRLGLSLIPEGAPGRLILLSDGLETRGDGAAALLQAQQRGVETLIAPLVVAGGAPEVWVEELRLPARAYPGDAVTAAAVLGATQAQSVRLTWSAGAQMGEAVWDVVGGRGTFLFSLAAPEPGLLPVRFCVEAPADQFIENNCAGGWLRVEGAPRLLVVGASEERSALAAALRQTGLAVVERLPAELPLSAQGLGDYAALVLVNTPARALPLQGPQAIQTFVRDLGGGLIAMGGSESYGVGGWSNTALETALPVSMQVQDPRRFPPLAMVIVIDKSGSMAAPDTAPGLPGAGSSKIRLAGEAAARVAETLNDDDALAVVAYDDRPADTFGPVMGYDRSLLIERLQRLQAGGGGIYVRDSLMYAGRLLREDFEAAPGQQRHILLVADGSDAEQQEGVLPLVASLRAEGVTVSVIAVGAGVDVPFLQAVAGEGGGRFYLTERAADLPAIFTEETARARRSYIVEEPFYPVRGASWAPVADFAALPPLEGYVAATPKPGAEVVLRGAVTVDPLLAAWQYGLGRAVAWTSDAGGRWAADWVAWEDFPRFWGNVVRWVLPPPADDGMALHVEAMGESVQITLDVRDIETGAYVDGLTLRVQASQVGRAVAAPEIAFSQTSPGRYAAAMMLGEDPAPWLFRVTGERQMLAGWSAPYGAEYAPGDAAQAVERLLVRGRAQRLTDPAQAFAPTLRGRQAGLPLSPWLIAAAALLWPLDIALRRLALTWADARRSVNRLSGKIQRRQRAAVITERAMTASPDVIPEAPLTDTEALATRLKRRLRPPPQP